MLTDDEIEARAAQAEKLWPSASQIPWEALSDADFWNYFDNRRYRAGDRYVSGKVLVDGDPEIGRLIYPEARDHPREYWENFMLDGERLRAKIAAQQTADDEGEVPNSLPTLNLAALAPVRPKPKEFAIERIAPKAEVTLGTGVGAGGKSLSMLQAMVASAARLPFLRLAVEPGPAIFITCEDSAEELHWRLAHICAALSVDMASLAGKLHVVSLRGELGNELCTFNADGVLRPTPAFHRLEALVESTRAKLVTLDNVAHLYPDNESDRAKVTMFVNLLNRLAGRTGAAIILVGHPNKAGDDYSGSTAWLNAVRSHFVIEHDLETDVRTLKLGKANYSPRGEAIRFYWQDWAFVHEDDLPADTRAEMDAVMAANGENSAFLACLRSRAEQGDSRAVGPSPGPNYAPNQFEGMPQAKGYKKTALKRAMDRLYERGIIRSETVHDRKAKRDKTVIVEVLDTSHNSSHMSCTTLSHIPAQPAAQPTPAHTVDTTYLSGGPSLGSAPPDEEEPDYLAPWGTAAEMGR